MISRILSLAIVGMMLLSIAGAIPVIATPANSIYVVPSAYNFTTGAQSVGYKFNVSVWMNLNVASYAWQVYMTFNTAFLNCTKGGYLGAGDVDSTKSEYFAGLTTVPMAPAIDNVVGSVKIGESLQGAITAPAADKRLCWVELEITAAPGKYATFTSALSINNVDTYALDPDLAEITPITKYDGSVTYVWTLPAKPHLEVVPSATITYPKTAVQVGKLFDVQVILKGIDPAWACHNVTFTLTYDCATPPPAQILTVLGVTVGPLWGGSQVELYANVTYNYWPVQQKDVAFEIRDLSGELWAILVARTNEAGTASTSFRIPWPCDNPEELFGVWAVTATVDLACEVINDTLRFHFDYLVETFKVTTDKFEYNPAKT